MENSRLNKKIFVWSSLNNVKNGFRRIKKLLQDIDCNHLLGIAVRNASSYVSLIESRLLEIEKLKWTASLQRNNAVRGTGHNKLRTYRLFKSEFCTEKYLYTKIPYHYRASFTKFRCGVAPLRLETGRYENIDLINRT